MVVEALALRFATMKGSSMKEQIKPKKSQFEIKRRDIHCSILQSAV